MLTVYHWPVRRILFKSGDLEAVCVPVKIKDLFTDQHEVLFIYWTGACEYDVDALVVYADDLFIESFYKLFKRILFRLACDYYLAACNVVILGDVVYCYTELSAVCYCCFCFCNVEFDLIKGCIELCYCCYKRCVDRVSVCSCRNYCICYDRVYHCLCCCICFRWIYFIGTRNSYRGLEVCSWVPLVCILIELSCEILPLKLIAVCSVGKYVCYIYVSSVLTVYLGPVTGILFKSGNFKAVCCPVKVKDLLTDQHEVFFRDRTGSAKHYIDSFMIHADDLFVESFYIGFKVFCRIYIHCAVDLLKDYCSLRSYWCITRIEVPCRISYEYTRRSYCFYCICYPCCERSCICVALYRLCCLNVLKSLVCQELADHYCQLGICCLLCGLQFLIVRSA